MTTVERAAGVAPPSAGADRALVTDRSSSEAPRWLRPLGLVSGWTAMLAPFAFQLGFIVRANHVTLIRRIPDDAYYYLEIAGRVGRGEGFTFDGLHTTNGFHPLWQVLLVPVVRVAGAGTDTAVRAALVLGLVCCLAAVLLVVRLVYRVAGWGPALLGGTVAVQFGLTSWLDGMESPVVLLTLAVLATTLGAADRRRTPASAAVVGVASAFVVLSRMDFAPLLLVVALALWVRWRSVRRVGAWIGGCASVGIPFAVWWFASFGHPLSVSAVVKNQWLSDYYAYEFGGRVSFGFARYLLDVAHTYVSALDVPTTLSDRSLGTVSLGVPTAVAQASALVLLGLAIAGGVTALRRKQRAGWRSTPGAEAWALSVLLVVVVVKAVVDIVVAAPWSSLWYASPQRLAVAFIVGAAAWLGLRTLGTVSWPLAGVALACLVYLALPVNGAAWLDEVHDRHDPSGWQDQIDVSANWILRTGPPGVYGARDAGILGYRLDGSHPVVNLDGLVNDYEFSELVARQASLADRFRATGVDYFVGRIDDGEMQTIAQCGPVLWTSPDVAYHDPDRGTTLAPVRVVDVRGCSSTKAAPAAPPP